MILYAEVECMIYDAQSLKEKRSVLKRVLHQLDESNLAAAELDFQDLWQRTMIGVTSISESSIQCERLIDQAIHKLDHESAIEVTNIHKQWLG